MPHVTVRAPGHDRARSLGWMAVAWIEYFVVHGPGDVQGEPVRHGDEYTGFVVDCYAVDDDEGLRRVQEARVPLYERTTTMRVYSSSVIPRLLQTREYAKALLTTIGRFSSTPDDFEAAADARVARAEILHRAGRTFSFVVEEAALRRVVGDAETMADQLGSLFALASLPTVSLGVIPTRAPALWPLETFTVYDEESVSVELLTAGLTITAPSEVAQYLDAHHQMSESALVGPAAYRIIGDAIAALG